MDIVVSIHLFELEKIIGKTDDRVVMERSFIRDTRPMCGYIEGEIIVAGIMRCRREGWSLSRNEGPEKIYRDGLRRRLKEEELLRFALKRRHRLLRLPVT